MDIQCYIEQLKKEHTDACLVITDNNLKKPGPVILWANQAMSNMTGYSLEELLGQTPRVFQGEETDRKVLDRIKDDLLHGRTFEGEILNYKKDKTVFRKTWRIAPILDADGKVILYFSVHYPTIESEYLNAIKKIIEIQKGIIERLDAITSFSHSDSSQNQDAGEPTP